jgi:hypothetical protein
VREEENLGNWLFNRLVAGSNPARGAKQLKDLQAELPRRNCSKWLGGSICGSKRQISQEAKDFARVCEEGEAEQLYDAHLLVDEENAWRLAMRKVARLGAVSRSIQKAFIAVWVEHKHLMLAVGDRWICAAALRLLMPGGYKKPMILYRGDDARRRQIHSFSWTADLKVAREFARKK